jgi:Beta-lactamase superfamily domain
MAVGLSGDWLTVMIDGGPGAAPDRPVDAWLVTDEQNELRREIRDLAASHGVRPELRRVELDDLAITPRLVEHTSHPASGYLLRTPTASAAWAPEFSTFPRWATGVDLLLAEGASWDRPIRFAGGVGGHMCVLDVARAAREHGVRRVVFAHLGRPTLRAIDRGDRPPYGEWGRPGRTYRT